MENAINKIITVNEYLESLGYAEARLFAEKLHNWLGCYTDEVIHDVLLRLDEIVNDPNTLNLISELYTREAKERKDEIGTMWWQVSCFEQNREKDEILKYGIHNHPLEHADAYRHILYDMYIG